MLLVDAGYQMVREGDDPEDRAEWAYPLGRWLIIYYCINAGLRMISVGVRQYLGQWRYVATNVMPRSAHRENAWAHGGVSLKGGWENVKFDYRHFTYISLSPYIYVYINMCLYYIYISKSMSVSVPLLLFFSISSFLFFCRS